MPAESWSRSLLGLSLLVFAFVPGVVLRLLVCPYPKDHPWRTELLGELYARPYWQRPLFFAEQLETALSEGLPTRVYQATQTTRRFLT